MWELPVLLVVGIGFVWNLIAWPRPNYARELNRNEWHRASRALAARMRSGSGTVGH